MSFKNGDRIVITSDYYKDYGVHEGDTGEIVVENRFVGDGGVSHGVLFDEEHERCHTLDGLVERHFGLWVLERFMDYEEASNSIPDIDIVDIIRVIGDGV